MSHDGTGTLFVIYNKLSIFSSNNKRKGVLFFVLCFFGDSIFAWSYVLNKISICFFFTTQYCILCGISFTPVQQKCQYRHKIHNGRTTFLQKVPRGKIYLASIFQHTKMSFSTFTTIKQQQSSSSLPSSNSTNNNNNNINHHQSSSSSSSSFWSSWKCIVWLP